jgi:hypothetical protein
MPDKLPEFAAGFSLVSFRQDRMSTDGAVAIHAGPGIPYAALMMPVPRVSTIHRVSASDPVSLLIERK